MMSRGKLLVDLARKGTANREKENEAPGRKPDKICLKNIQDFGSTSEFVNLFSYATLTNEVNVTEVTTDCSTPLPDTDSSYKSFEVLLPVHLETCENTNEILDQQTSQDQLPEENIFDVANNYLGQKSDEDPFHASSDEDETWTPNETSQPLATRSENKNSEELSVEKRRSRKRARKPETWKRNIKKSKVNQGQSYVSSSGKLVEERRIKLGCNEKCSFKCHSNIDNLKRQLIFQKYWELSNIDRQRQFLLRHMQIIEPAYRYAKTDRGKNYKYFFEIEGKPIRVCKKFFHGTLAISDMMSRTAQKKVSGDGILETEKRGTHNRHKQISKEIQLDIRNHIESMPTVESHYLRAQTKKTYFEGNLNLSTLYKLYVEMCNKSGKPFAKYYHYAKIFNYEYNIGFFSPKKDQCGLCETYKNSSVVEKETMQESYEEHLRNKTIAREEKKRDTALAKENPNLMVAVYGMQAVLPTPCSFVSDFYYKSKLATLNFTIYNISNQLGYCYVWNETIGKRGANEIGSFLINFLNKNDEYTDIIFYSDNCCGQNKNKFIAATYLYAVTSFVNINTITHKFLITGHTQNEGDSMHSAKEREKNRMLKANNIYIPAQWIPIIALAKKKGTPYLVNEVQQNDIYDIKSLTAQIGKQFSNNTNNEKVMWNSIKVLQVRKDYPHSIFYKTKFEKDSFDEILINRSNRRKTTSETSTTNIVLKNVYCGPLGISKKKKDGLLSLCHKNLIKKEYHGFYESLPIASSPTNGSDSE